MKFKKLLSVMAVSALAMGLFTGCGSEEKAADQNVVKVGVFLPLTGDNAAGGELELRGIKLANQLHPEVLGKKVELVVADNKSDKACTEVIIVVCGYLRVGAACANSRNFVLFNYIAGSHRKG